MSVLPTTASMCHVIVWFCGSSGQFLMQRLKKFSLPQAASLVNYDNDNFVTTTAIAAATTVATTGTKSANKLDLT